MRITEVETIVLRLPTVAEVSDGSQDAFVVRLHTDAGISGIGEGDSMPTVLKAAFDAPTSNSIGHGLRELLIGQDPRDIEPLVRRMMAGTLYLHATGLALTAISAAEIALWDIAGKAANTSVSRLLGGAFRKRVRAYASVLFPEDRTDTNAVQETGKRLVQQGFTAVKFGWGGFGQNWRSDVALVRAAREGVGDDIDLMVDVGLCWDVRTAIERTKMLEEFSLYWLEAPLPFYPMEAYAELCNVSPIRISCESAGGFWESTDAIRRGKLHVVLPDVSNAGGIGEWKRIAEVARTAGSWCVPHCFSTGVQRAASLHLVANQPDTDLIECSEQGSPLNIALVRPALRAVDGYIDVPDAPGLGIELDPAVVERYRLPD
jgi:L-alanine-DL-glutamate epimerase-like enolase superfamily enzyme